jgi:Predicted transcriptional regulators
MFGLHRHRGHRHGHDHGRGCAGFSEGRGGPGMNGRGPFGRHRGGPFGGRGSRMFDSGALRLVVLGLIAEEPRHGYDIIKALEARFQGTYSPSPGAIYPMLQMLEEADLVTSTLDGNKRLFSISEAGRAYLEENRVDLDRINAQLDEVSGEMRDAALGQEFRELRRALMRQVRGGALTADQARKAVEILRKARGEIEGL